MKFLEIKVKGLEGELATVRVDSTQAVNLLKQDMISMSARHGIEVGGWEQRYSYLESLVPRWWERPTFVVPVVVVVTMWVVLRVVSVSV